MTTTRRTPLTKDEIARRVPMAHPSRKAPPLPDEHGNVLAQEGCDRCYCGAKYWEHDHCVSCGEKFDPTTRAI